MSIDVKHYRLPPSYTVIRGSQGSGKTSLATALLCTDYKYHRDERYELAYALAERYSEQSGYDLTATLPPHVYYSNIPILLDPRREIYTHYIDVSRLALPNDNFPVQYFPRSSFVFITEADGQLWCRDFAETNHYLIQLLKLFRHNLMTVVFDTQSDSMLDKAVRQLATWIYQIERREDRRRFLWIPPRQTWHFLAIANQEAIAAQQLDRSARTVAHRSSFTYKGNVFERYDSFAGEVYFLNGIERFGYKTLPHPHGGLDPASIRQYIDMHPLTKPAATKKGGEKTGKKKAQPGTAATS